VSYPNKIVLEHLDRALGELLDRSVGVTEGVRTILQWRFSSHGLPESLFDYFVGADSSTDCFPLGEVRSRWDSRALAREDAKRALIEEQLIDGALRAATEMRAALREVLPVSSYRDPDPRT
jgi:hypothetical protein